MKLIIPTSGHFSIAKSLEMAKSIRYIAITNKIITEDIQVNIKDGLFKMKDFEVSSISNLGNLEMISFNESYEQITIIQGERKESFETQGVTNYKLIETHDPKVIDSINSIVKCDQTAVSDYCCCP